MVGDLAGFLNEAGLEFSESRVTPEQAGKVAGSGVADGSISSKSAKEVLTEMWAGEAIRRRIIETKRPEQISDAGQSRKS